jgi:hypothetical protein
VFDSVICKTLSGFDEEMLKALPADIVGYSGKQALRQEHMQAVERVEHIRRWRKTKIVNLQHTGTPVLHLNYLAIQEVVATLAFLETQLEDIGVLIRDCVCATVIGVASDFAYGEGGLMQCASDDTGSVWDVNCR